MTSYIVFVGSILDNIFDTLAEAEVRVAEIISRYPFINPDTVRIVG